MERDAFHISFKNSDKSSILFLNPRYKDNLPTRVMFRANFNVIPSIDYPLTDLNIPIFSDKMISLLNQVGEFEAIFTEVIMVDDTYQGEVCDIKGNIKTDINTVSDYKAVTIVNREDCFDFENSIFKPSELNPNIPGFIEKLVLKKSDNLPPIFRIKELPSKLLVTEQVKLLIESNNLKGCIFEEVESLEVVTKFSKLERVLDFTFIEERPREEKDWGKDIYDTIEPEGDWRVRHVEIDKELVKYRYIDMLNTSKAIQKKFSDQQINQMIQELDLEISESNSIRRRDKKLRNRQVFLTMGMDNPYLFVCCYSEFSRGIMVEELYAVYKTI